MESSSERISPDRVSAMLIWLSSKERFTWDHPVFRSNCRPFSFLLIDQQSETLWATFLQWVQKSLDRLFIDFNHCRSPLFLGRLEFRLVLLASSLDRLDRSVDSVEWWASANSSIMSPIDFRRMSSVRTWSFVSSKFNFGQLLAKVVQNTSQLTGKLGRRARALTSSWKLIPWEESSDNTRLKVLMWEVVGYVSLVFMFNNCRISINFDEEDFFSYTTFYFSNKENAVVSFAILK